MKEYFLVAIADRDEAVKALRERRQLLDVQITVAGQATDEYLEWLDVRPGEIFCVMAVLWQDYVDRAKLSPARTFKSPMDVVQANDLGPAEKLAILKAWEVDERALLRAEDEGMGGGEHAHLHKVQAALDHLRQELSLAGAPEHTRARCS